MPWRRRAATPSSAAVESIRHQSGRFPKTMPRAGAGAAGNSACISVDSTALMPAIELTIAPGTRRLRTRSRSAERSAAAAQPSAFESNHRAC
ncbi:hypothetical protein RPC_1494 [Rhodopseudomonas palustris BisB18]|uniref:Uncharacterized protein n=1 Tax=Rhodopseudomonas palustris (strain BisB18) TaxID=316056 RepID=Q218Y0_RHOPB